MASLQVADLHPFHPGLTFGVAGDWEGVGRAVKRARAVRWPRRIDFATATGLSYKLISDIETGRRDNFSDTTKAILEAALLWEPGSIDVIARGGRPKALRDGPMARLVAAWPQLSPSARAMLADLAEQNLATMRTARR